MFYHMPVDSRIFGFIFLRGHDASFRGAALVPGGASGAGWFFTLEAAVLKQRHGIGR